MLSHLRNSSSKFVLIVFHYFCHFISLAFVALGNPSSGVNNVSPATWIWTGRYGSRKAPKLCNREQWRVMEDQTSVPGMLRPQLGDSSPFRMPLPSLSVVFCSVFISVQIGLTVLMFWTKQKSESMKREQKSRKIQTLHLEVFKKKKKKQQQQNKTKTIWVCQKVGEMKSEKKKLRGRTESAHFLQQNVSLHMQRSHANPDREMQTRQTLWRNVKMMMHTRPWTKWFILCTFNIPISTAFAPARPRAAASRVALWHGTETWNTWSPTHCHVAFLPDNLRNWASFSQQPRFSNFNSVPWVASKFQGRWFLTRKDDHEVLDWCAMRTYNRKNRTFCRAPSFKLISESWLGSFCMCTCIRWTPMKTCWDCRMHKYWVCQQGETQTQARVSRIEWPNQMIHWASTCKSQFAPLDVFFFFFETVAKAQTRRKILSCWSTSANHGFIHHDHTQFWIFCEHLASRDSTAESPLCVVAFVDFLCAWSMWFCFSCLTNPDHCPRQCLPSVHL